MKYNTLDEAILVIENEENWKRATINLPETHQGFTDFYARTSVICNSSFMNLGLASQASLLYFLWDNQGKDTKVLAERRNYHPDSPYYVFFEKLYKDQQKEVPSINEKEEINMSTTTQPAFQTKHFVFGTDAATMSDDQLIEAIKKLEAEISNLKQIKTKSTAIETKLKELKAMLSSVVALLDNR